MANVQIGDFSWERMLGAVEAVKQRLLRACATLEEASLPYAVAGEQAAAYWISQVDPSAVRNTPAVEIVVGRSDLSAATTILESAGFVARTVRDKNLFLERADAKLRTAVEILIAEPEASPADGYYLNDVLEARNGEEFRVVSLEPLVRVAAASFRTIDRVCLRDMMNVGLIDDSWCDRLPEELVQRLQVLLADPEG